MTTYPIGCPRCKGHNVNLAKDGNYFIVFCQNQDCLKADSEASKSQARKYYLTQQERDNRGLVITGAKKYNLGKLYENACLSKWTAPQKCQSIVNNWINNQNPFLVCTGGTGTGKTFLCSSVLNYLYEKHKEVEFTSHRQFIQRIQEYINDGKGQYQFIKKIADKEWLIFDDLGSAANTCWQQEMILELVDMRYSNQKKTLITTNLTPDEMVDCLGERVFSRLFEKNNMKIELWTADRRIEYDY